MARQAGSPTEPRTPLSRERILRAAIELADEHGIESLTMRKLGQALGVEAMSLYNHVANKDDLLNGITELIISEVELPSADEEWDAALRKIAISAHDALSRHAWACNLMLSPAAINPARIHYMDSLLAVFRESGFSADVTYSAYHALDAHIFGFSLWQATHAMTAAQVPDLESRALHNLPLEDAPYVTEHIKQHMIEGPHRGVSAFELTLDQIIAGLKRLRADA